MKSPEILQRVGAAVLLVVASGLRAPNVLDLARRNLAMNSVNRFLLQRNDQASAIHVLQGAVSRTGDPRLEVHLGRLLVEAGQPQAGERFLTDSVRQRPFDDRARLYL